MSANITAASTLWRRTGWSVTSAQSSASAQMSKSRVLPPDLPVLGQRAAGLAHEPDGRAFDGFAAGRANEKRTGHGTRLSPYCVRPS